MSANATQAKAPEIILALDREIEIAPGGRILINIQRNLERPIAIPATGIFIDGEISGIRAIVKSGTNIIVTIRGIQGIQSINEIAKAQNGTIIIDGDSIGRIIGKIRNIDTSSASTDIGGARAVAMHEVHVAAQFIDSNIIAVGASD